MTTPPLTPEQYDVLAYVVIDPDAWWEHCFTYCVEKYGEGQGTGRAQKNLNDKVNRWRPEYETAKAQPGYKTRAEREQEAALPGEN